MRKLIIKAQEVMVRDASRDVHGSDRIGSDRTLVGSDQIGLWSDRIKTIGYPRIRRSDPKFRIVD